MWRGVRYLIIDEVSMVSAQQMSYIDIRLREVFGQARTPFGGVSVITVGDFYQLPPVTKGRVTDYVFKRALWRDHFKSKCGVSNSCMLLQCLSKTYSTVMLTAIKAKVLLIISACLV